MRPPLLSLRWPLPKKADAMQEQLPKPRRRAPYNFGPSHSYLIGERQTNSTEE